MAKKHKKNDKVLAKLLLEDVLKYFQASPSAAHHYKEVCEALGISDPIDRIQVMEVLESLVVNGQLNEPETGKFRYISLGSSYVDGLVDLTSNGSGYVIPEDGTPDILIREDYLMNALNGDKVRVHLFARRKGKKLEGEVVEILKKYLPANS
jgi:exoribonuclease R